MKNKILFISTLLPYPLNNGGKIKTYNTLKMLSEKYSIDLICYYENDEELKYINDIKDIVENVECIKGKITTNENKAYMCKLAFRSVFSMLPLTVLKFYDSKFKQLIDYRIKNNKYDIIYVDHLQISINLKKYKTYNTKYIIDEHNCEHLIMKRKFKEENNIFKKVFFNLEYLKLKKYEKDRLKKFDKIIVLSENDKKEIAELGIVEDSIEIIPIPFSEGFIKENLNLKKDRVNILFLGTMSWMPNYEGVLWFLKKVVPLLRSNKINFKLYIIGKGPSKEILDYDNKKDIEVLGFVEDIDKYIETCDCMVVPIFFGSGIRVKIIEAFAKKIPVISTTIGAEGLNIDNLKNILIADNENEFSKCIKDIQNPLLRCKLANNARITFENKYSFRAIKDKFLKSL